MRKTFLLFCLILTFICHAYNIEKVENALNEMKLGHVEESFSQLKKLAAVNEVAAQYYIGLCYEHGIGIDADASAAFSMYRRAAERGFPPAMYELAKCYQNGIGVTLNQERAKEWMERYYKKNDNSTIPNLIDIYANRELNPNDIESDNSASQYKEAKLAETSSKIIKPERNLTEESSSLPKKILIEEPAIILSDVDIDVPVTKISNPNLFALIIANENYQDVAVVPYALNDGESFAQYCKNTLGMPETNVHFVKDATLNNIKRELNLMKKIADAYKGEASFIVYYAGHGIPDEKTRDSYLMPVDGFPADVSTCLSLNDFYSALSSLPSEKTIVLLDACFSGASREGGMLVSARGVAMRPKSPSPVQNLLVISSASGDETSYPYEEKKHGLFTYFLLKKLKETQGNASIESLMDYIHNNVTKTSIVVNGKSQTPVITPSSELGEEWKNWKLK